MKSVVLLSIVALSLSITLSADQDKLIFEEFQQFIKDYGKYYETVDEFMKRFSIFKRHYLNINSNKANGIEYEEGINEFSDMTPHEFARQYLTLDVSQFDENDFTITKESELRIPGTYLEKNFDWRTKKVVSGVKNQGRCGSCWAFATISNLESLYAIKHKKLLTFSEQQLVDCDNLDYSCNGGIMDNAFTWIKKNGGVEKAADYPYVAKKQTCKQNKSKNVVKVTGFEKLGYTDEQKIKSYLVSHGPLAIAMNATPLQTYKSGILDKTKAQCNPSGLNHAVVLVGYGYDTKAKKEYWIVRNSWGTNWGEKGYVRVALGKGVCGINTYVTCGKIQ